MIEKQEKFLAWAQFLSIVITVFITGTICGIVFEQWRLVKNREPIEIGDFSEEISLLRFDSIENGILKGSLEGEEARIVIQGAEEVTSLFPGDFAFSITEILPHLQKIPAPEGMVFVASKNGKYIYPIDSPNAALISVKNRIFFRDEAHANAQGFLRKK